MSRGDLLNLREGHAKAKSPSLTTRAGFGEEVVKSANNFDVESFLLRGQSTCFQSRGWQHLASESVESFH